MGLSAPPRVFFLEYFSFQDYINQSIKWLAPFLLSAALYFALSQWLLRDANRQSDDSSEIGSSEEIPRWLLKVVFGVLAFLILAYTGFATAADLLNRPVVPRSELYAFWGMAGPLLWGGMVWRYAAVAQSASKWKLRHKVLIFAVGAAAIISLSLGLSRGESVSNFEDRASIDSVTLEEGKSVKCKVVLLLSDYSIISKFPEGEIEVIPNREVKSILPGTHRYQR